MDKVIAPRALRLQRRDRPDRLPLIGGGGGDLRLLTGPQGRTPGSYRGTVARVSLLEVLLGEYAPLMFCLAMWISDLNLSIYLLLSGCALIYYLLKS